MTCALAQVLPDDGWWIGRLGDAEGMFPANRVSLDVISAHEAAEAAVAVALPQPRPPPSITRQTSSRTQALIDQMAIDDAQERGAAGSARTQADDALIRQMAIDDAREEGAARLDEVVRQMAMNDAGFEQLAAPPAAISRSLSDRTQKEIERLQREDKARDERERTARALEREAAHPMIECPTCLEDVAPEYICAVQGCTARHAEQCYTCVARFLQVRVKDSALLQCPTSGCTDEVSQAELQRILRVATTSDFQLEMTREEVFDVTARDEDIRSRRAIAAMPMRTCPARNASGLPCGFQCAVDEDGGRYAVR